MRCHRWTFLWLGWVSTIGLPSALSADEGSKPANGPKKVLVELFTSQGCNSCPSANEFLGELAKLGYGPDRIVPVSFHVDYFNEPWIDPFSNKDFSRREMAYNSVLKRNDLYFTPMMMVDGRSPMLGSNRPDALKAIKRSLAEKPGASLKIRLTGQGETQSVAVDVTPISTEISGRSLMIGLALTEGPILTKVKTGENAGSALVEPAVVRSFEFKQVNLESSDSRTFAFPVKLPTDSVVAKCRVAAFVQDWDNGKVYQAESLEFPTPKTQARASATGR